MKKSVKRVFEPIDKELWNASERDLERLENSRKERSVYRAEKHVEALQEFKKRFDSKAELNDDDYAPIEDAVAFCQNQFWRHKAGIDLVLEALYELYKPLVIRKVSNFCDYYCLSNEFDDWMDYARHYFDRSVTGDLPETIKGFEGDDPKEKSLNRTTMLFDKRVPKLKRESENNIASTLQMLEEHGVTNAEVNVAEFILKENQKDFAKWINQPPMSLQEWTRFTLDYHLNVCRKGLKTTDSDLHRKCYVHTIAYFEKVLTDQATFDDYITQRKKGIERGYKRYKKNLYKDHRYGSKEWHHNFTMFLNKSLPRALNDIYKNKAYKMASGKDEYKTDKSDLYASPSIKSSWLDTLDYEGLPDDLTRQERDVCKLYLSGYKKYEIAKKLDVSAPRVSAIFKSIKAKSTE